VWRGASKARKMLRGRWAGSPLWAGKDWDGVRGRGGVSTCWDKTGYRGPPAAFLVSRSLSAAALKSPVQTFLQVTDQPITHTHAVTQLAPLWVKRGENHPRFWPKVHLPILFPSKEVAQILASIQHPALAEDARFSHTSDHPTLQSGRDSKARLLRGGHLAFLFSQGASTQERRLLAGDAHCLVLPCSVDGAGVFGKEYWAWSGAVGSPFLSI